MNFGLAARVDDNSQDALRVAQGHAAKKHVVVGEGKHLHLAVSFWIVFSIEREVVVLHSAVELVDQVVRAIQFQRRFKLVDRVSLVLECVPEALGDNFVLEVGLSVEVLCLHVADTFVLSRLNHDHVGREKFILVHFHEVADLDIAPAHLLEVVFAVVVAVGECIVLDRVLGVAAVVLISVLNHRRDDDEDKRWEHGGLSIGNRDDFDSLHYCDEGEVDIRRLRHLLEQVHGQESYHVVL